MTLTELFVSPAYAQAAPATTGSMIGGLLPMVLIFGIMYFLLIRPQQKKMRDLKAMIEALRRGDRVVTGGGIIGVVSKVEDDNTIEIEIAQGVKVKVVKATVTQVLSKTEPAA